LRNEKETKKCIRKIIVRKEKRREKEGANHRSPQPFGEHKRKVATRRGAKRSPIIAPNFKKAPYSNNIP
jgi:hypothetical protein